MNRILCLITCLSLAASLAGAETKPPMGVCPPFQLKDEAGNVINPVRGQQAVAAIALIKSLGGSFADQPGGQRP